MDIKEKILKKEAKVGVIGLGYVGLPLAMEFAKNGYKVIGFDTDRGKVNALLNGNSYVTDVSNESIKEASGNIAYYVKTHDVEEIFNCIQYILDVKNKAEVSTRKRLGVEFAFQHTWQVTVSKTVNLYKSCIGN